MAQTQRRIQIEASTATVTERKSRLTLSLEESTVRYLRQHQAQAKARSLSACVESLVNACRRRSEEEELNRQTLAYYDAISDDERAENVAWGQLSEREFRATQK
jgi:hypothetical protein